MHHKSLRLFLASLVAPTALLLFLVALDRPVLSMWASSDTHYVASDGNCGGVSPCYDSVQAAVDAADSSDEIRIAAGVYTDTDVRSAPNGYIGSMVVTQVVFISKTITLQGGYTITNWTTPNPGVQLSVLDARGQGRVIFVSGDISPTISGLWVTGGDATGLGGQPDFSSDNDAGGGIYVLTAAAKLHDNVIISNTISFEQGFVRNCGAGVYLAHSNATLNNNSIMSNTLLGGGGGLCLYQSDAALADNYVSYNWAEWAGGLRLKEGAPVLTNNIISNNTADYGAGGGLYLQGSSAILNHNEIISNTVGFGNGGGLRIYESDATLTGNVIIGNFALGAYGSGGGGGLILDQGDVHLSGNIIMHNSTYDNGGGLLVRESDAAFINNVIAENQADTAGSGVYIEGGDPRFYHTTIALNSRGDGSGIHMATSYGGLAGTVVLTNTILVSQTTGVVATTNNTAVLDGILWSDNDTNTSGPGVILVTNPYTGNPAFAADNYHLTNVSVAIDKGVDTWVTDDVDGQTRPHYGAADLGADEWWPLVAVKSAVPNTAEAGEVVTYTLALRNVTTAMMDVTLTDTLPSQVIHLGGPAFTGGSGGHAQDTITWTGTVYTDTPVLITWTVQLSQDVPYSTAIANTAVVSDAYGVFETDPAIVWVPPCRIHLPLLIRQLE